jgi:hypothetical protein
MNPFARLLCATLLAGAFALPSHAQLVHLAFDQSENSGMIFRATSADIPWNHSGGYVSRFDFWYDASDLTNPERNLWRARVHAYGGLGDFEIIRPLQTILFGENSIEFEHSADGVHEELDFTVWLTGVTPPETGVHVPPFTIDLEHTSFYLSGGRTFFDIPNLSEGYGFTVFNRGTASVVDSIELYPVPEPSTYAACAAALLGLVVLRARRQRSRLQAKA